MGADYITNQSALWSDELMPTLNPGEIFKRLHVQYPFDGTIWGYMIYTVIFLSLVTMFLQKKSNTMITLYLAAGMMAGLIDKIEALNRREFGAFAVRIVMWVMPMITAGATKWGKSRGPAILAGIIGMIYMFIRWYIEQAPK
jgi:hypothetical protein